MNCYANIIEHEEEERERIAKEAKAEFDVLDTVQKTTLLSEWNQLSDDRKQIIFEQKYGDPTNYPSYYHPFLGIKAMKNKPNFAKIIAIESKYSKGAWVFKASTMLCVCAAALSSKEIAAVFLTAAVLCAFESYNLSERQKKYKRYIRENEIRD